MGGDCGIYGSAMGNGRPDPRVPRVLFQGPVRVGRRSHLTRSGLFDGVEVLTSAPCFSLFGPSEPRPEAPTMAAADFCIVTATIAGRRAVNLHDVAASFFDTQRTARHGAGSWYPGGTNPGFVVIQIHRSWRRSPQVRTRTLRAQTPHLP